MGARLEDRQLVASQVMQFHGAFTSLTVGGEELLTPYG